MLHDGGGLYLRVSTSGAKFWVFRYQLDGKCRDMGLGPYPDISLAEARGRASESTGSNGRTRSRPTSDADAAGRMRHGDLTTHGFRSTFSDRAAERAAYPREVVEMALAHAIENKVEAAYRHSDLFEKRRKLMVAWAGFCVGQPGGKVVPIAGAR